MFITGASGLLGRHLQRSPAAAGWEMVAPGSTSLDVRDAGRVRDMVRDWKPAVVVHLAYRLGDQRCIVDGSRHVAEAAAAVGARLVHVSTDVVFGGRPAPYTETDRLTPITAYARMKAAAEEAVATACPTAAIVRTSLLYATDSLAPAQRDVQRALDGEAMTFYTDEVRCPAHAADVAAAIARLAAMPQVHGPLHVAGPEAISRADFAAAIATWLGGDPSSLLRGPQPIGEPARPGRVVLDTSRAVSLGLPCRRVADALR